MVIHPVLSTIRPALITGTWLVLILATGRGQAQVAPPDRLLGTPTSLGRYEPARDYEDQHVNAELIWTVRVARDQARVFADPELTIPVTDQQVRFMDDFGVINEAQRQGGGWSLKLAQYAGSTPARGTIQKVLGWVAVEDLLLVGNPVRVPNSLLARKILVLRNWRQSAGQGATQTLENATIRTAPSDGAKEIGTLNMQQFAYVYQIRTRLNRQGRRVPDWYLIGSKPMIVAFEQASALREGGEVGWLPAKMAVEWNTREALEPQQNRQTPANIYSGKGTLRDQDPSQILWVDQEFGLAKRRPMRPHDLRHPIVKYEDASTSGTGFALANVIFLEALVSGTQGGGGTQTAVPGQSADEVARILQLLGDYGTELLENINIVFVMDGTQSMCPDYFKMAQNLVLQIARGREMQRLKTRSNVRFGALVYRDDYAGPGLVAQPIPLSQKLEDFASALGAVQCSRNDGDNAEEALYYGIQQAYSNLIKAPGRKGLTFLMVVGDAGTSRDERYTSKEHQPESSDLAKMLRCVALVGAVHVAHGKDSGFGTDMAALLEDLRKEEATKLCPSRHFISMVQGSGETAVRQAREELEGLVGSNMGCLVDIWSWFQKIKNGQGGAVPSCSGFHASPAAPSAPAPAGGDAAGGFRATDLLLNQFRLVLMNQEGMSAAEADRFLEFMKRDHGIMFAPGWVTVDDLQKQPVMRKVVLFSNKELVEYSNMIDSMIAGHDTSTPLAVQNAWKSLCHSYFEKGETIGECFAHQLGVTKLKNHAIFSLSQEEVEKLTPEQIQPIMKTATKVRGRIDKIIHSGQNSESEYWFGGSEKGNHPWLVWIPEDDLL